MLKLSIIIPVYNVAEYIEECILSCERQDIPDKDYEIIAVNDGSTDKSLEILNDLAAKYKNIKIISQENRGLGHARNTGLEHAQGRYVWFVDSDDWIDADVLTCLYEACDRDELDCLWVRWRRITDERRELPAMKHDIGSLNETVMPGSDFMNEIFGFYPYACSFWFKRSFLIQHRFRFREGIYYEDVESIPRIVWQASSVRLINRYVYNYRTRELSITTAANPKKINDYFSAISTEYEFMSGKCPESRYFKGFIAFSVISLIKMASNPVYLNEQRELISVLKTKLRKLPYTGHTLLNISVAIYNITPRAVLHLFRILRRLKNITA